MPGVLDPQHLGETMQKLRTLHPSIPFHEIADYAYQETIRPFKDERGLHAKRYQLELKERALAGDPYAISLLAAQDGKPENE
jgi:hypothetical protein